MQNLDPCLHLYIHISALLTTHLDKFSDLISDSQVISLWPLVDLCPCHFECKVNESTDDAALQNNSTNFINTTTTTTQILNALEKNTEESITQDHHDDIIMKNTIMPSEPLENKLPETTTVTDSTSNFDNATQQSISSEYFNQTFE